jgi:hypothetical protein
MFLNQIGKSQQDIAALSSAHLLPCWERLLGCLDSSVNILLTS